MSPNFIFDLGSSLVFTGTELFLIVLIIWWFFLYPRRKRQLMRLTRKFGLTYSKGALTTRESNLKGSYHGYKIKMNPFTGGGDSWVLLKHPKAKDFLAVIKPRKALKIFHDPINLLWSRREMFTKNLEFDSQFKIIGTAIFPIEEIIPGSIQKRLIKLGKKREFEIQIVRGGVFFTSKKEIQDIDSAEFILDTLVEIANNLTKKH